MASTEDFIASGILTTGDTVAPCNCITFPCNCNGVILQSVTPGGATDTTDTTNTTTTAQNGATDTIDDTIDTIVEWTKNNKTTVAVGAGALLLFFLFSRR